MNRAARHFLSFLMMATLAGQVVFAQANDSATLRIDADTPVIEISTRTAGRNFMRLPSLNYRIELLTKCPIDLEPKAMSVSVADTRRSLAETDISADQANLISMTIPASQIGPVAVDGFCVDDAEVEALCANDEKSQMTYASKSLDVTLSCLRK
jgi:hypothetical protein